MSYRKGRSFEYQVRDMMSRGGWLVIRAARSKPVDLICIKDGKVALVECKYDTYISKKEKEALKGMAERYGAIPILAYRFKRKGLSIVDLRSGERFKV